ncbi:hypothetical protein F5Y05DRAFT_413287 [Hypoxylon sp. FL0543]|nr:hypothetical protein F5Y05DRAFT_413287 [Hypoxylon sp. FL0543]
MPCASEVTDRRPTGHVPIMCTSTLTTQPEGMVDGRASTGSTAIRTQWRMWGEGGAGLLQEIEIESNVVTEKMMVKSSIENGHSTTGASPHDTANPMC